MIVMTPADRLHLPKDTKLQMLTSVKTIPKFNFFKPQKVWLMGPPKRRKNPQMFKDTSSTDDQANDALAILSREKSNEHQYCSKFQKPSDLK